MEVMTDGSTRRTILTLLDGHERGLTLIETLQESFNVVVSNTPEECLEIMHDRFNDLSCALIDVDVAEADDFSLLKAIVRETNFNTIPVLIVTRRMLTEEDMRCLEEGAIDFVTRPYFAKLLIKRVENAITCKRTDSFHALETMLSELPSNIFLKDAKGRYVFQTHYWGHNDMGDDPNWDIRGKTDLEVRKDKANAVKAMEADRKIIETGVGTDYIIEENTAGKQEFLELIKRPVFDKDGNVAGIIALINDVTERELLKRELEKHAHTDVLTGLGNHRSFDEYVQEIPHRSDFPIGVISADCDHLKVVNDTRGHLAGDEYLRLSALVVETSLPEGASAFRTGGDELLVFLPGMSEEQAEEVIERMRRQQQLFNVTEGSLSISFGAAVINGPEDSIIDAIDRADRAMYADKAAKKNGRDNSPD